MRFTAAVALLASAASLAAGASLPRGSKEDAFRDFGVQTEQLKQRGMCRTYPDGEPSYSSWEAQCEPTCADARKIALDKGDYFSTGCNTFTPAGHHLEEQLDPEKRIYHIGTCMCDVPFVNWIGEGVIDSLPAVGQVTCAVFRLASKEAAELLAAVFGAAAAKTSTQVLSKVAKTLKKEGKGLSDWEKWVKEHVEGGNACDFSVKQVFEDFTGLNDKFLKNI